MRKALKLLLNRMDAIAGRFEEVGDTAVREAMREAIEKSVLEPVGGYVLPEEFGMYEPEGDAEVKTALEKFTAAANVECAAAGLATREARLGAFQDGGVTSTEGTSYDEYFGHDDGLDPV